LAHGGSGHRGHRIVLGDLALWRFKHAATHDSADRASAILSTPVWMSSMEQA
jgi:hypothetical protein